MKGGFYSLGLEVAFFPSTRVPLTRTQPYGQTDYKEPRKHSLTVFRKSRESLWMNTEPSVPQEVTLRRSNQMIIVRAGTLKQVIWLQAQSSSLYNCPRSYLKTASRCSNLEFQDLFSHPFWLANSCWWIINGRVLSITMLCFITGALIVRSLN